MLVSAIIPTYNREKTICRAVDSVLAQTWKQIELIVVDDGSTDRTCDVLKQYGDKIRIIRRVNGGASAARNTGIKAATGEIISFLDSDDEWLPTKTERQVNLFRRTETSSVACCVCNARMLFSSGTVNSFQVSRLYPTQSEGVWINPAEILIDRFLFFNQVVAVRREALDRCGYFREDLRIMEDYDLALRLATTGPWAFIAEPLVTWHEDAGSGLSRNLNPLIVCRVAFQILDDLKKSAKFGPMLPAVQLRHRIRLLQQKINAMVLTSESGNLRSKIGMFMSVFLKTYEAIYRRLPFAPRMITRPILVTSEHSDAK